ncbi:MAG TPA: cobalamin-binding protein, partial [Acidimicrobiales bacterium]
MRIVSLLPSTTEIICDLGLADDLFGVTVECNWPTGVQTGREIVVRTFADPSMTPREIDEIVRQRISEGLDLYALDDAALQRCDPDLILSQDLCRVCAVASGDVEAAKVRLNC